MPAVEGIDAQATAINEDHPLRWVLLTSASRTVSGAERLATLAFGRLSL